MSSGQVHEAGPATDGRWFTYVFPCAWEDYGKIGFSRDPLRRISELHRRWFEFFDLDAGAVVQAETQRDARDLELALRRPLRLHRAPSPLTVEVRAGGKTEWVRGANLALVEAVRALAEGGYPVYGLRAWLHAVMQQRVDRLYAWSSAQLPDPQLLLHSALHARAAAGLRDHLDGYQAMGIDPLPWLPEKVRAWYLAAHPSPFS